MKKYILIGLFLFVGLTSFVAHKFYVSIYQINYNQEKKTLQITTRIFTDDLNKMLEKKYNKKTNLGEKNETPEDIQLMNNYILDNFSIKINGQQKPIRFISKELETNVLIGYYSIKDIAKIKKIEIQNTTLLDLNSEQQNIIQTTIYGKKESLLLTGDSFSGVIKVN
jgi:hypothetical protein